MNAHLKTIEDLLLQAAHLTEQEKQALLAAVTTADKQWSITDFKLERTEKTKKAITVLLEETIEELELKRKAVEVQKRELEIEAALERVRTIALSMKEPADMLGVCRIISQQLELLDVKEIRNVQTAIFNQQKGTYLNYEYFRLQDKTTITEVEYNLQPDVKDFVSQMLTDPEAFFTTALEGAKLKDWIEYQGKANQFVDPHLNEVNSLHYYFYSIGPGALGISTYSPLSEEGVNLLKRFRNVFELAYRRFIDIEQVEAQAREANIEAALERVRSRALAMQKTDELKELIGTVSTELGKLDLVLDRCFIMIYDVKTLGVTWWMANPETPSEPTGFYIKYHEQPPYLAFIKAWQERKLKWQYLLKGKIKKTWDDFLFVETELSQIPDFIAANMRAKEKVYLSSSFNNFGCLTLATLNPLSDEQFDILVRFAKVFDLTYTRFNDLKQAEAQAREAQVEAALDKIRAKVMAMSSSKDLNETSLVFGEQLRKLGIDWQFSYFWLVEEEKNENTFWITWPDYKTSISVYTLAEAEESFNDCLLAWQGGVKIHDNYVPPEEVQAWLDTYQRIADDAGGRAREIMVPQTFSRGVYYYDAMMKYGSFGICINKPATDEEKNIQSRFAVEFERAYTRFLDLKKAEAQSREAQIELGLERVRARAMAMQSSDELSELIGTVFTELTKLDLVLTRCVILIYEGNEKGVRWWMANSEAPFMPMSFFVQYADMPFFNTYLRGWQNRSLKWQYILEGEDKVKTDDFLFHRTELSELPDFVIAGMRAPDRVYLNASFNNFGNLTLASLEPLSNEHSEILLRFAKVFDLTYTRFNDLKIAEAQAREAKIEAALERVRSRTMAMHKTDELPDAAALIYKELSALGLTSMAISYAFVDKEEKYGSYYTINLDGTIPPFPFIFPHTETEVMRSILSSWKRQEPFNVIELGEEDTLNHQTYIGEHILNSIIRSKIDIPFSVESFLAVSPKTAVIYSFNFTQGYLFIIGEERLTEMQEEMVLRFAKVFGLTYRRFLDLKQAEEQAREAKIEAALERVRAKAMAMHKSEDLNPAVATVFEEFEKLNFGMSRCGIGIINKEKRSANAWITSLAEQGTTIQVTGEESMDLHPLLQGAFDAVLQHQDFSYVLQGSDMRQYYLASGMGNVRLPESQLMLSGDELSQQYYHLASFEAGGLFAFRETPFPEEEKTVMKRFAHVFNLTYKRFLDLQKAEAQAKEAQIEAALERVRSKSMAMHRSEELDSVIKTIYSELKHLDVSFERCFIMIFDEQKGATWWMGSPDDDLFHQGFYVPYHTHPPHLAYLKGWKERQQRWEYLLEGQIKKEWDDFIFKETELSKLPQEVIGFMKSFEHAYLAASFENFGCLTTGGTKWLNEESLIILSRFAKVFDQTYTRFLDLQKAEAQAREAKIEASLERVRAKAMSMHNSQDLADTIGVFYKELQAYSITPRRCGVGLLNKKTKDGELFTWNTTEQGESLELVGTIKMEGHPVLENVYDNWLTQTEYHPVLRGNEIKEYYKVLRPQMPFPDYHQDAVQYGYFFFFKEGGVYAWTGKEMNEEELKIYRRFTSVLSLTYKRYEDLKMAEANALRAAEDLIKLQTEKKRAEDALSELQATQKQLIQSEKMASLGELTAGIAHEIQNPLNFVNNFSELNLELVHEMQQEMKQGNASDALDISDAIKDNLKKISHHGKRADAIVKNMLQHSRKTTEQKEPTDINALVDEFLRLSYHGVRAKDKSFNALLETHFDPSVGKVTINGQDIGRVLINLFSNAFYSVHEKKKQSAKDYQPTVAVSTRRTETPSGNSGIEIIVKDNGTGIPEKILQKIYQPFFTTKPTGEGTGLGLSLSYDIITKGHGGELKVDTLAGEFAEFTIQLPIS